MKVIPRKNTVLLKIVEKKDESVIIRPDSAKADEKNVSFVVSAISEALKDTDLKIGDTVITVGVHGFTGIPVMSGEDKCFIVEDDEIVAIKEG
tara:strand:+ start:3828 stop:4106 length:279 start_codon:yes stop_codon:yes gene_type:complete